MTTKPHPHDNPDLRPVLAAVLKDYSLPLTGDHGIIHWARVLENGLLVGRHAGANLRVVSLFAVLHDSKRLNECSDPAHGPRAALFAESLQGEVFSLETTELELLKTACRGHTHEKHHPDVTIQTCWDADRLDLGRVGITPHPDYLNTSHAKLKETMLWADGRASMRFIPELIQKDWGIDLRRIRG
jgi:uncharacterized protein